MINGIIKNYDILGELKTLLLWLDCSPDEVAYMDKVVFPDIRKRSLDDCKGRIESFVCRNLVQYHNDVIQCNEELRLLHDEITKVICHMEHLRSGKLFELVLEEIFWDLVALRKNVENALFYCDNDTKVHYYERLAKLTKTELKRQTNTFEFEKQADTLSKLFDTFENALLFVQKAKNTTKSSLGKCLCDSSGYCENVVTNHEVKKNDLFLTLQYFGFDVGKDRSTLGKVLSSSRK